MNGESNRNPDPDWSKTSSKGAGDSEPSKATGEPQLPVSLGNKENIVKVPRVLNKEELLDYLNKVLKDKLRKNFTKLSDLVDPDNQDAIRNAFASLAETGDLVDEAVWEEMKAEGLVGREHPGYGISVEVLFIQSLNQNDVVAIQVVGVDPNSNDFYSFREGRLYHEGTRGNFISDLITLKKDGSFNYVTPGGTHGSEFRHSPTKIYGIKVHQAEELQSLTEGDWVKIKRAITKALTGAKGLLSRKVKEE